VKRSLYIALACFALGFLIIILWAGGALGYTITGGTMSERATAESVLAKVPWATSYIESVWPNFRIDIGYGGHAWGMPDPHIDVNKADLNRNTAHELWHLVQLAGDNPGGPTSIGDKWLDFLRGHGYPDSSWSWTWPEYKRFPWESFAENARVAYHGGAPADTYLGPFSWQQMTDFFLSVGIVPLWKDIPLSDSELVSASYWGLSSGVFQGREDGTFRPWDALLKRHVALIAQRMSLPYPSAWLSDYGIATRGQVRDAIPGLTWTEARRGEPILRSQLLRLMWRAR